MILDTNLKSLIERSSNIRSEDHLLYKVIKLVEPKSGVYLAGGSIRRTLINQELNSDFDFFFRNSNDLLFFVAHLTSLGFIETKRTKHHITYKFLLNNKEIIIQCINFRFFEDVETLLNFFDFTICQFAIDFRNGFDLDKLILSYSEFALWDLGRKKLVVNKINYPISSMRRLLKYSKQGFIACSGCLQSLLMSPINNPDLLKQLDIEYID